MFCINCGFKLNDGSKFCVSCGAAQPLMETQSGMPAPRPEQIPAPAEAPAPAAQTVPAQEGSPRTSFEQPYQPDHSYAPQPVKKGGKGKLVLIILLIVLLVGAGIGIAIFAATGGFDRGPSVDTAAQYLDEGDYDSAVDEYESVIEADPLNAEAYIGLAEAYLADGKEKKAIKALEEALDVIEDEDDIREIEDFLSEFAAEPAVTTPATTTVPEPVVSEPPAALFDMSAVTGEWYCEEVFVGNEINEIAINMVIDGDLMTMTSAAGKAAYVAPEQYLEDGFAFEYDDFEFTFTYNADVDMMIMVAASNSDNNTVATATFMRGQLDLSAESNDSGKILNIWTYNEEFKTVVENYYAGYEDGYIGDVQVEWHIIPAYDNQYQSELDMALLNGNNLAENEQVDLFIIEPDYSHKYVGSPFTLPVYETGLTEEDTAQMYPYTKQIGTDNEGVLKAVSWQATPGVFAYRRSIAKAVLGTDDPAAVQEYVASWSSFSQTAELMKAQGYSMLSGNCDAMRVFAQNSSESWVSENGELIISDELILWLEQSKQFTDNGYNNGNSLWSEGWINDMSAQGNVFGFFAPTWLVNWTLPMNSADAYGDWAVCCGPDAFNWGSAYICAAYDTDNASLVGDIMYQLACREDIMYEMATDPDTLDYTNNMAAMARAAEDSANASGFLGGQNPFAVFHENAMAIDLSNATPYDMTLNDLLTANFEPYFNDKISFEDALKNFTNAAIKNYPELFYTEDSAYVTEESAPVTEE